MTPATLIGVLTILGYSLYDTVVVFDKVRENVRDIKSSTTKTYSEAANLAVNQVLVRSINTTLIGVLPVVALLFAGAVILGEGPLKDLALALFVGMVSGAYSSIFIATPLLAQLKEREPDMKKHAARIAARRAKDSQKTGGEGTGGGRRAVANDRPAASPASTRSTGRPDDSRTQRREVEARSSRGRRGASEVTVSFVETGGKTGLRPLSDGAANARSHSTNPAASGRSSPMAGRSTLTGERRRADGRVGSWTNETLVSLPARTSSPAVELLRRALLALGLVAIIVILVWVDRDSYTDNHDQKVSLVDAIYYATVTITTTGYGDITPITPHARILNAIVVTPMRIAFLVLLVGTTLQVLANEGRRMFMDTRWRKRMRNHVVVVGYGTKGKSAVETLENNGTNPAQIVIIDGRPSSITDANLRGTRPSRGTRPGATSCDGRRSSRPAR